MKELQILHDYKTLAYIINVVWRATVAIPESIKESKKILKELE